MYTIYEVQKRKKYDGDTLKSIITNQIPIEKLVQRMCNLSAIFKAKAMEMVGILGGPGGPEDYVVIARISAN